MEKNKESAVLPAWYKDAVIYQLHVKSFLDGKNDGIGDFPGLTRKLGYLESLGINTLWLQPFYPSPQRDDGYDIADYMDINPSYGTMADFRDFLDEAHKLGIRVITELVLNHTSDQHAWFRKSRTAKPGSYWRNFYVWSESKERYREARIIFKDFETSNWTWDPVAGAFFWHRFYSHQPDLNFEHPAVHDALFRVIDYWLEMGVDGLRLDAVPYLYEKEGTNCENLPETFAFLKKLRSHVEERFPECMLLAEANQWPEDAVAYFGNGDMCHMAFHFPLMPRMFMALQMEDRFPIIDILDQTPSIPDTAQWAIFLRNHDELTLEMVSEEERDFMYRSYARDLSSRINLGIRRRLAPLVQNSRRRIELLNIMLFSLPGAPVIYYGDEIGMGDNHFLGDRNGVRTPMQWSPDRNAGFSSVNPQQLFLPVIIDPEYHYQSVNVENEERNLSSLLWWMRRAIAMRRKFRAFSRGSMAFVPSDNASVLSFVRRHEEETILVVINLSRFSQMVSLDLSRHAGLTPFDVFSGNRFAPITTAAYRMTLGFHDYFWLKLTTDRHADLRTESYLLPDFEIHKRWTDLFSGVSGRNIETEILPGYLEQRTTAGCRPKKIQQTTIIDRFPIRRNDFTALLLLVRVRYSNGENDIIMLPFTLEGAAAANAVIGEDKGLIFGLAASAAAGIIYDCAFHPEFLAALFENIRKKRAIAGKHGSLTSEPCSRLNENLSAPTPKSRLVKAGKRNTCAVMGERIFVKLFRRLDEGAHPEIELQQRLTEHGADLAPRALGSLSYRADEGMRYDLGIFSDFFHHSKTLWPVALDSATLFLEESLAGINNLPPVSGTPEEETALYNSQQIFIKTAGTMFEKKVRTIGELTARMHIGLAAVDGSDDRFRTEPYTVHYQRSLYQSFRGLTHRVFSGVEKMPDSAPLSPALQETLRSLASRKASFISIFMSTLKTRIPAFRMRVHGDFHLGQIMFMDEQYRICDFEGFSRSTIGERRLKRSPLHDAASMVHSLYNAAHFALLNTMQIPPKARESLFPFACRWAETMAELYINSYFESVKGSVLDEPLLTDSKPLLRLFLLERAIIDVEKALLKDELTLEVAARRLIFYLDSNAIIAFSTVSHGPELQKD